MKFLLSYINQKKSRNNNICINCINICSQLFSFITCPLGAVLYPLAVSTFLGAVILIADYKKEHKKHLELLKMQELSIELMDYFPNATTIEDKDYQKIIELIKEEHALKATQ